MLIERLAGQVEVDRAIEIIESGVEPLRDLIGALHSKLLLAGAAPPAGTAAGMTLLASAFTLPGGVETKLCR